MQAWGLEIVCKEEKDFSNVLTAVMLPEGHNADNLRKIIGGCNENNLPMIKTFKSLGYQLEKRQRNVDFIDNQFSDHFYFRIFKEEFFNHYKWAT